MTTMTMMTKAIDTDLYKSIDGWFDFADIYDLAIEKFKTGPRHFVEIGAFCGKSTAYMASRIGSNVKFSVVDTWVVSGPEANNDSFGVYNNGDNIFDKFWNNMKLAGVQHKIEPIIGYSRLAVNKFYDQSLDFVFIDADHSYESVREDIHVWLPKIKPGGIIAGHDYRSPHFGVIQAVDERFGHSVYGSSSWLHVV